MTTPPAPRRAKSLASEPSNGLARLPWNTALLDQVKKFEERERELLAQNAELRNEIRKLKLLLRDARMRNENWRLRAQAGRAERIEPRKKKI